MSDSDPRVLIPVGQDLGPQSTTARPGDTATQVFDGAELHELNDDEYAVWRSAAGDDQSLEAVWNAGLTMAAATRAGVAQPQQVVEQLRGIGLLDEVLIGSEDSIRFAVLHRIEARLPILGPSGGLLGGAAIGLPGAPPCTVSADCANVYLYGPVYDDLWSVCGALAEVTPTEQFERVPKQLMLAELFLMEAQALLAAGALVFLRAHLDRSEALG